MNLTWKTSVLRFASSQKTGRWRLISVEAKTTGFFREGGGLLIWTSPCLAVIQRWHLFKKLTTDRAVDADWLIGSRAHRWTFSASHRYTICRTTGSRRHFRFDNEARLDMTVQVDNLFPWVGQHYLLVMKTFLLLKPGRCCHWMPVRQEYERNGVKHKKGTERPFAPQ